MKMAKEMDPNLDVAQAEQDAIIARKNVAKVLNETKLHYLKTQLNESQVKFSFDYIKKDEMAKLAGILAHFVYWSVFGGFNELPIDNYHMENMFKTVMDQLEEIKQDVVETLVRQSIEKSNTKRAKASSNDPGQLTDDEKASLRNKADIQRKLAEKNANKLFQTFIMPIIVMTIRLEIDVIFQITYQKFFNNIGPSGKKQASGDDGKAPYHVQRAQRLMNGVISELLDPNLFFSRLSFLESGKEALDIKDELNLGKRVGFQAYKLPSLQDKYYTRSTRVRNFYQSSTEGKVRAKFSENLHQLKANLREQVEIMRVRQ